VLDGKLAGTLNPEPFLKRHKWKQTESPDLNSNSQK
jgi:hypothetical protein